MHPSPVASCPSTRCSPNPKAEKFQFQSWDYRYNALPDRVRTASLTLIIPVAPGLKDSAKLASPSDCFGSPVLGSPLASRGLWCRGAAFFGCALTWAGSFRCYAGAKRGNVTLGASLAERRLASLLQTNHSHSYSAAMNQTPSPRTTSPCLAVQHPVELRAGYPASCLAALHAFDIPSSSQGIFTLTYLQTA